MGGKMKSRGIDSTFAKVALFVAIVFLGGASGAAQGPQGVGSGSHARTRAARSVDSPTTSRRVRSTSRVRTLAANTRNSVATSTKIHAQPAASPARKQRVNRVDARTTSAESQPRPPVQVVTLVESHAKPQAAIATSNAAHHSAGNDRLANLIVPLQTRGLLPADIELKDACSHFKAMSDCVAALHASHNLNINFDCMKWDMTGVPLTAEPSCPTPGSRNLMPLSKAIQALKPDAYGIDEALNAQKQAYEDLKDSGAALSKGSSY